MSSKSASPEESLDGPIIGFEEEGDIVIKIEKVVYVENIKDYNDERIGNEVRDLVKLDFQTFFGRMHFYNQYLANIVKTLRGAIDARFKSGDESLYHPIRRHIYPLIEADAVRLVDTIDDEGGNQVLTDYLQKRQLLNSNNDSLTVTEARAIKHTRPFTMFPDTDSKWLMVFPSDTDCLAVNDENKVIRPVRTMTHTQFYTDAGPYTLDPGDKVAFKGFMFFGKVNGDKSHSAVFNIDDYINNINGLNIDDKVSVLFNTGIIIDSHTVTSAKGTVRHMNGHLARIEIESDVETIVDFCISDLAVNNCFVYGPEYQGDEYSKRFLFNQNWMFVMDQEPLKPETLASIVFPTVGEGIDIFPDLSHVTSLAEAERILGGEYKGRDSHATMATWIGHRIRDMRKRDKAIKASTPTGHKRGVRFGLSPGLDMLHFHKNAKVLSKYFSPYVLTDTFVDGDQSRFEHISRNPHLLYAYCLNLLRKHYQPVNKFLVKPPAARDDIDFEKDMELPANAQVFTNERILFSTKADDGEIAVLQAPGRVPRVYKMHGKKWVIQGKPTVRYTDDSCVFPGGRRAVDLNAMDAATRAQVAAQVAQRIKNVHENKDDLVSQLATDIIVHMMLGKFRNTGRTYREMQYKADVDYAQMLGTDEEPDVDELLNNQEVFGDVYVPVVEEEAVPAYDFDLGQMLQEPIGVVFALFIEMFGISVDGEDLKIMLYNVSKYRSFDDLKARLHDKERALKAQVQQMKRQNKSIDKAAVDALIKQRLMAEENSFMAEYYGQVVAMACAFIVLYVQCSLPAVKFRPLAAVSACNKQFSYMGYPLDEGDAPKSLVKYLACAVSAIAPTSGKNTPLHMAHTYFKSNDLEGLIRSHIESVLSAKPHYRARINAARKRMSQRASGVSQQSASRVFYGFRPNPESVRARYPDINLDDMLMYRAAEGAGVKVNACCMQDIESLKGRVARKEQHSIIHRALKIVKNDNNNSTRTDPKLTETIDMSGALLIQDQTMSDVDIEPMTHVAKFMACNTMFENDRYLADIGDSDDAWNALSAHVTMHWQLLTHAIKATSVQQELWFEVFVRQEDRYRNPSEVKTVFEKVVRTTIPAVLARAVNNYLVDTRHIDKKTHIVAENRAAIKATLLDRESEYLISLVQQDEDGVLLKPLSRIVSGCFTNASQLAAVSSTYRVILLYNYIILKVCYLLMHASTGAVDLPVDVFDKNAFEVLYMTSPRVRSMADFVRMLLDKVCRVLETNHVDTDKIRTEFEKQREHVKQDLMRKMEKFSKEERAAFRVLKEKTGISSDYLDQIQMQAAALIEMMNQQGQGEVTENDAPDPQGLEDIPMDWVGENPDDIELEDDGSGY